jgi:O-antigen/teichoic acid export membrane protein
MAAPEHTDVLRTPEAGGRVIRGGAIRGAGYGAAILLAAGTSVLLLRYLGVVEFGRFATVSALLGIVSGITDAGLTAVGARELAVRAPADRAVVLRNLVALRMIVTPVGVGAAVLFAAAVGYDKTLVYATLLGGLGVLLVNTQATMMLPLSVELRLGVVTAFEVARAALAFLGVAILVAVGTGLVPFFGVQAAVGAVALAVTPLVLPRTGLVPGIDRTVARMLVREALPLAAALAMNVVYFRVLVILTSLLASDQATGYFGTSFRIFEVLFGLPLLVLSVALPVLSVAGAEDEERLRYSLQRVTEVALLLSVLLVLSVALPVLSVAGAEDEERLRYSLQRVTEVALLLSVLLVLVIVAVAEPAIVFLAGEDFRGAAPVLQIQAVALIPVFLGQTWQLALVSIRRQSALAWATGTALVLVIALGLALIPTYGATGAAVAAVLAESVLALLLLGFLHRLRPAVTPSFRFVPRVALAGALATPFLFAPISGVASAACAAVVFLAVVYVAGVLPPELIAAFRRR